ncbi:hypothetical protein SMICM17S_13204 [Streptomyces microflavus]
MLGLEACLERIEANGPDTVMARHASAAAATRAGAVALGGGLEPYVLQARDAAPVATTLRAPATSAAALVARALELEPSLPLIAGGGALSKEMIRVNHYGADATRNAVLSSLAALGAALADTGRQVDFEAARRAVGKPGRAADIHNAGSCFIESSSPHSSAAFPPRKRRSFFGARTP